MRRLTTQHINDTALKKPAVPTQKSVFQPQMGYTLDKPEPKNVFLTTYLSNSVTFIRCGQQLYIL
jgi:hypothetical protein